jgi:hypothetical protein
MTDESVRTPSWGVIVAMIVVAAIFIAPIGVWPWDHDEVQSLVELGVVPLQRFPGPPAQMERMHRLIPVWNVVQGAALRFLPANEWGTRVIPSLCGALVVLAAFLASLRARRVWFAWSLVIMMGGSQTLVWLSQQNRFYSLALLWTTLGIICISVADERRRYDVLTAAFAVLAVLSHNLTMVVFGIGGAAAVGAWSIGSMPRTAARRALFAAIVAVVLYGIYLRPLVRGWVSGGTGGTPPLLSFVAQTGIAPIALALVGAIAAFRRPADRWLHWWIGVLILSVAFVGVAPSLLGNWNPRYALFFMPPVWVLAAAGSAVIAESLAPQRLAVTWLIAVVALLTPKLASHFIDGSRHDFRAAAQLIASRAPGAKVLSNWPGDVQYYLEPMTGQRASYWGEPLPDAPVIVVIGSNAWEPSLRVPGRSVSLLGEIGRRRFDEQSHLVRVYLVEHQ